MSRDSNIKHKLASNASVYTLANFRNNPDRLLRSNTYKAEGKMSADLMRLINSIGKSVFVEYYDVFSSSKLSTDEKIEKLPKEYSINGSRTRINCANKVFERGLEKDALRIVIQARVDDQIKARATYLLQNAK